jgi:Eukaryotic membrane protein family
MYNVVSGTRQRLPPSQKADLLRTLLILLSICILVPLTDVSKIYHSIRGQDTIKLYVIFNALEVRAAAFHIVIIADRLTSAL